MVGNGVMAREDEDGGFFFVQLRRWISSAAVNWLACKMACHTKAGKASHPLQILLTCFVTCDW